MRHRPDTSLVKTFLLAACVVCGLTSLAPAADWPQWRCDAGRTAACEEDLAGQLNLAWSRQLAEPKPAWPKYPRLCFDTSYEPVVMGDLMFVPSMVTDSLTALDTATGEEKWKFFTDGPVRFAPVAFDGKVAFVSDDGYLYCLKADSGALQWKVSGLPPEKTDRKVLGNDRLISLWPARGGPVLKDGRIYFACGIWPFEGVSVYAVEAATGKAVWANHGLGEIDDGLTDHSMTQVSGISPQGYLSIIGDKLFVPSGRALPGRLDLATGELQPWVTGWGGRDDLQKGSWSVTGGQQVYFQSGDTYDIASNSRVIIDPANAKELGQYRDPVFADGMVYFSRAINQQQGYRPAGVGYDRIVAWNVSDPVVWQETTDAKGKKQRTGSFPEAWTLDSKFQIHLKAGLRLYGSAQGQVAAVDLTDDGAKVSWTAEIEGTPSQMLAADGKLFVVTKQGAIHAFTPDAVERPTVHAVPSADAALPNDSSYNLASAALNAAGTTDGYCLILGLGALKPAFLKGLVEQSDMSVVIIEPNADRVDALRRRLSDARVYGSRVAVHQGDPRSCSLPPYFASLILTRQPIDPASDSAFVKTIYRSLRPCGGVAVLQLPKGAADDYDVNAFAAGLSGAEVSRFGPVALLARPGTPPGSGEWSDINGDASQSLVARDERVKPPFSVLWFGGAVDLLYPEWDFTHSRPPSALVSGGRMFFQTFPDLHAVDIYTGEHLWTVRLPGTQVASARRNVPYVAAADMLYLQADDKFFCLDAATGETSFTISVPADAASKWGSLSIIRDQLLATAGKLLVAMDRTTGEVQWTHETSRLPVSLSAVGDKVFLADAAIPGRRGEVIKMEGEIVALNLTSGAELWRTELKTEGAMKGGPRLVASADGDVLLAVCGAVSAYNQNDGAALWESKVIAGAEQPMLYPDQLVTQAGTVFDPRTGAALPEQRIWDLRKRGCTRNMGGLNVFSIRHGQASVVDPTTKEQTFFRGIRTGCTNGLIQAGGLLNAPDFAHGCSCNYPIFTSFAMVNLAEVDE